jgi:hypothetical protein
MSQPPSEPSPNLEALGIWAGVILSVLLACASAFRVFFGLVSREEFHEQLKEERAEWGRQLEAQREAFAQQLKQQYDERIRMHGENQHTAQETFKRLSEVEKGVARIEGYIEAGSFPGVKR